MRRIAILLLAAAAGGCMVGPDYRRPAVEAPQAWRFEEAEARGATNAAWWEQFDDPVLDELIRTALRENRDVKIAAARVQQFLGQYGTTRAALFPQVGAGGTVGQQRASELSGAAPLEGRGIDPTYDVAELYVNASWEIDLWGKVRRASEAAQASVFASEEDRRAVLMSLVSAVANSYVNLRSLDKQLEISRLTAAGREKSYQLFTLRFEGGVVSQLELNQMKSEYEAALASIPAYEKAVAQQENALSLLLGRNPGTIPRGRSIDELVFPEVPAGLPSDLLANRPDIRRAEQDLVAANANIGVAKARYFPSISLTGFFGVASADLSELFTSPAQTWSAAVPVTVPIFTAGAIAGQVQAAEAFREQLLQRYQQAIQSAFREVDDALVDQSRSREQLAAQKRQVEALREYARIARLRFDEGYTSYLEVVDAERSLFNAQLSSAQTQGTIFQALVNLYKAIGGGWIVTADRIATEPPAPPAGGNEGAAPARTEGARKVE